MDLGTSTNVALILENLQTIITFAVGTLWSIEAAAESPERFYKAFLRFTIYPNQGVRSNNTLGVPDIPTNIMARVDWTDVGGPVFQVYQNPLVYIDPACVPCTPVTRCQELFKLISSIAYEELGVSHILNAEGEKMQTFLTMENLTFEQLMALNQSVIRMVESLGGFSAISLSKFNEIIRNLEDCE